MDGLTSLQEKILNFVRIKSKDDFGGVGLLEIKNEISTSQPRINIHHITLASNYLVEVGLLERYGVLNDMFRFNK